MSSSSLELHLRVFENLASFQNRIIKDIAEKEDGWLSGRGKAEKKGRYPYIPLYINSFINSIRDALKIKPSSKTFLDVGCGIGDKVQAAHTMGLVASGLEVSKFLVGLANSGWGSGKIIQANALTYKDYGNYDIIYMYEPLTKEKLKKILLNRVANQMRAGALLVYHSAGWRPEHKLLRRHDGYCIWEKIA